MRISKTMSHWRSALLDGARRRHRARADAEIHAQIQPRARAQGALSRRLPEMGEAGRGAHQGRSQDRRLPLRAARSGRGHHRADPARRQHRPEHQLGAHGQLRARHRRDERPLFRRDARGGRQAAQGADRRSLAGGAGRQIRPQGALVQLGAGLPAFLHQQAGQEPGGSEGPAHPHAAGADLAGIDPRARRRAGGDGLRRDVSGPAAAGHRRRGARLQQHPGRTLLRGAEGTRARRGTSC